MISATEVNKMLFHDKIKVKCDDWIKKLEKTIIDNADKHKCMLCRYKRYDSVNSKYDKDLEFDELCFAIGSDCLTNEGYCQNDIIRAGQYIYDTIYDAGYKMKTTCVKSEKIYDNGDENPKDARKEPVGIYDDFEILIMW